MGCMNYQPCCYVPMPYCQPVMLVPFPWVQTVVHEIDADTTTTTAQAFVGGTAPARLTVEYIGEEGGETAGSVTVTVTTDSQTATWSDSSIAAGYHVNDQLPAAKPGSKLVLEVTGAVARLRWCETICC